MPIYALEDLDDALDAPRSLLLPVDRTRWLKVAGEALELALALVADAAAGVDDPLAHVP